MHLLMRLAQRIGRIQAWLIFTLFYFIILAPVALVFKLLADPLRLRPRASLWTSRPPPADPIVWGRTQS